VGQHKHLYNTTRWKVRRQQQLEHYPLCRFCLEKGIVTPATVADHVVRHSGDVVKFEGELQSLCDRCHNNSKKKYELGIAAKVGIDGWNQNKNNFLKRRGGGPKIV